MFIIKAEEQRLDEMAGNTMFIDYEGYWTEDVEYADKFETKKEAEDYLPRLTRFSPCWQLSVVPQTDYIGTFDIEDARND